LSSKIQKAYEWRHIANATDISALNAAAAAAAAAAETVYVDGGHHIIQ